MPASCRWPYRQDDPVWAADVMWSRDAVIDVHRRYNGASRTEASRLLRPFTSGNTIGNEGCLLTCLAMVLRLLTPPGQHWTPRTLNRFAHKHHYYTPAGLAMATLYADIVSHASQGEVQLLLKEEYLPGESEWPRTHASTCLPFRAYRTLTKQSRQDVALVLKTGTYDDTMASHFVVVDPVDPGRPDDDDFKVLDPGEPIPSTKRPWLLSDSSRRIREDDQINTAWRRDGIDDLQLGGVWVFARWMSADEELLGGRFITRLGSLVRDR